MTSTLIKSGAMPFTGAEICAELGIDPAEFSDYLNCLIATEVIMSRNPVHHTTWWVSVGPHFELETMRGTCGPSSISEPFEHEGRMVREVIFEPRDWAVEIVHKRVIAIARHSEDIHLWRAVEEAAERKREEARKHLKTKLEASVKAA